MAYAPFMDSVVVGTAAAQLSVLVAALTNGKNAPVRCSKVILQYNVGATGNLLIGNSNVATAHAGFVLTAGQIQPLDGFDQGLVLTSDIYLIAGAASQQVNVTLFGAGGL